MRKIKFLSIVALGFVFAGCSEDPKPEAPELKQAEKVLGAGQVKPTMTDEQALDLIKQYEEREAASGEITILKWCMWKAIVNENSLFFQLI